MSCSYAGYYSEKFRKAKKQHKCIECLNPIEINDKYVDCRWGGGDFDFSDGAKQHLHRWHVARCANYGTSILGVLHQNVSRLHSFSQDIGDGDCVEFGGLSTEFQYANEDDFYSSVEIM